MPAGDVRTISLTADMADKAPLWRAMTEKHGLKPYAWDELVAWPFADYVFGCDWDVMSDVTKSRRFGFHDVVDSEEMFVRAACGSSARSGLCRDEMAVTRHGMFHLIVLRLEERQSIKSQTPSPHETHRLPLLRPLDPVAAVADAVGVRRAAAIDRARRRGRGTGRRRRLFPGPSFRPPARLAVSAARGLRRAHQAHRDRHRGHRHALREPALHGGGRGRRRPHRRRPPAARHLAAGRPSR